MDPMSKHGGGTLAGCISGQYEKNFVLENALNDLRFKEAMRPKIRFRSAARSTKSSEARKRNTTRVLEILKEREGTNNAIDQVWQ